MMIFNSLLPSTKLDLRLLFILAVEIICFYATNPYTFTLKDIEPRRKVAYFVKTFFSEQLMYSKFMILTCKYVT
jgi:hypothetical protein